MWWAKARFAVGLTKQEEVEKVWSYHKESHKWYHGVPLNFDWTLSIAL